MGLSRSKRIKFIKENGISMFLWRLVGSSVVARVLLPIYPKLVLSTSQYKTFKLAYKHFGESYKNIIAISPFFFIKNIKKHIEWLESDIFKNQYGKIENFKNLSKNIIGATNVSIQNSNQSDNIVASPPPICINAYSHNSVKYSTHLTQNNTELDAIINPYPPLFNPTTIGYQEIGAKMAWELNLPLPTNYKFVWVSNGGSGSEAFMSFLGHCGVNFEAFWHREKEKYMLDFNMLLSKPQSYNILYVHDRYMERSKYIHFIQKRDFIYIAGDVISRMKVGLNHLDNNKMAATTSFIKNPTLDTPLKELFPRLQYDYSDSTGLPNVKKLSIHVLYAYTGFYEFFSYATPYINNLYILSTNDLSAENAFKTFQRLYEIFLFPKSPSDKKLFIQRANMFRGGLYVLPIYLRIGLPDIQTTIAIMPYRLSLDLPFRESKINISRELFSKRIIIDSMEIVFMINKDEFAKLIQERDTFLRVKSYITEYISMLEKSVEHNKSELISETDILLHLKENKTHREHLQKLMKAEAEYFKTYCNEIFSSWKYYQEFEKMCMEEGDM